MSSRSLLSTSPPRHIDAAVSDADWSAAQCNLSVFGHPLANWPSHVGLTVDVNDSDVNPDMSSSLVYPTQLPAARTERPSIYRIRTLAYSNTYVTVHIHKHPPLAGLPSARAPT
jgi:hypothetical protein